MKQDLSRFVRPELACLLLLACSGSGPGETASHPEIVMNESLGGAIEVVSVERLEPGR